KLARLDFDREGVLRERQVLYTELDRDGKYVGLESGAVTQFLEDRERALLAGQERSDDKRDAKKEAFANEDRADE
ncbi:MAG: hypothetical protein ACYS99_20170, partial [Planctomycetota bacterium]